MVGLRTASLGCSLCLFVALATAEEPAGYAPVAPPAAVHAALQSQWGAVRDWLKDKDYASASEAIRGLATLAQLYSHQGDDPAWRQRCADLQASCAKLADAAKRKAAPDADLALLTTSRLLEELAKHPPTAKKAPVKDYQPGGGTKTWMLLLEGVYVDAKSARTPKDLELLALALAEESHAVGYLRGDARWRDSAREVKEAAFQVAKLAQDNQLDAGKKALKVVYQRCEVCHGRYQK